MTVAVHGDALVVDLELFVGLEVVPDEHPLLAPDQRRSDLHRRQPVDVDVRDGVPREIDGDVGDVHETVQVGLAGRDDRFRLAVDQKIHDGKVVGGEIPHDAHIVLKQPEVDPCRVVVVDVPQHPLVHQLTDLPDRPREQECVIDHDRQISPRGQLDELLRLGRGGGERLLDEHVLAVLQSALGQREMRVDRRHDRHRVDLRRGHELRSVPGGRDLRIGLGHPRERPRAAVADGGHFTAVYAAQIPDDVRTPIAIADHTHSNHGFYPGGGSV